VKIHLLKRATTGEKATIASSIQSALVSTLEVPEADRYQPFNEYDAENFGQTSGHGRRGVAAADDTGRANVSFGLSSRRKRVSAPGTKPGLRSHQSRRPQLRSHPSPRRCPASQCAETVQLAGDRLGS
jgi:hypothetical protein